MMRLLLAILIFSLPPAAMADSAVSLFKIQKPYNPKNLIQVYVTVDANCVPSELKFVWWTSAPEYDYTASPTFGGYVHDVQSKYVCAVQRRLRRVATPPDQGCPSPPVPGLVCTASAYSLAELSLVGQSAPLVVMATKSPATGNQCGVGAYMKLNGQRTQIQQVETEGRIVAVSLIPESATAQVSAVKVTAKAGADGANWPCSGGSCLTVFSVPNDCN